MFNILLSITLTIVGTICITAGISFFVREKNNIQFKIVMLFLGIFTFVCCTSYAFVGFCKNFFIAYIARSIGLFGVIFFLVTESCFISLLIINVKKPRRIFAAFLAALGAIDYYLFVSPDVLEFIEYNERTCYIAKPSPFRIFHICYVGFLLICMFTMGVIWLKRARLKREKNIIYTLYAANIFMLFSSLSDTFFPLMDVPSFPTSCYGISVVCFTLWYVATRMNAFSISIQNLESYIFDDNNTNILLFEPSGKLAMSNKHAKEFLCLDNSKSTLHDIFEISNEDCDKIFNSIMQHSNQGAYRLKPRCKYGICSIVFTPVYDKYHDPYCITCFVYDISREAQLLKEVEDIKQHLQEDLTDKTHELEKLTLQSITTIANTIDAKDAYTKGHSTRVSKYSALLAETIGWDYEAIQNLKYIALLHDIGKIGVPDNILCKPDKLTDSEFSIIKSHTKIGGDILKDITLLPHIADGAKYHHERFDGNGYPSGLKGENIPLIARIISLADAYDAMNSKRVYRNPLDRDFIISELKRCRGLQFDPFLTDNFIKLIEDGKLSEIDTASQTESSISDESSNLLNQIVNDFDQKNSSLSNVDSLTGLQARNLAEEQISNIMVNTNGCIMLLHLNNLSTLNTQSGHICGDNALKTVANILKEQNPDGITSRINGNKFICFVKNVTETEAEQIATSILHTFRSHREADGSLGISSLSIGLCMTSPDSAFKRSYNNADKALYHIRQSNTDGYYFYARQKQPYSSYIIN